uniref:AB hydrolase-1 domain-containing protein n=1 Tax=Zea mays TaxID=4577 RepID=C0PML1_MAIZE|nr:unknown [Zea mays]
MAALAARGFRALAPDLRGYGDSSVPSDPAAYTIFHIVGDIVALLDHLQVPTHKGVRGGARLGRAGGVAPLPVPAGPGARRRRSRNTVLRSTSSPHHGGLRGVWRWLLHKSVSGARKSREGICSLRCCDGPKEVLRLENRRDDCSSWSGDHRLSPGTFFADSLDDRRRTGTVRREVREDWLHRTPQLLPHA